MALVQGGVAGNISGRSGAVVFARNRGGFYARDYVPPTDPESARQLLMRGALQSANTEWADFSDKERQSWANYAKKVLVSNRFGVKKHRSGREHFIAWFLAYTGAADAEPVVFPIPLRLTTPAPPLLIEVEYRARVDSKLAVTIQTRFIDPDPESTAKLLIVMYLSPPLALTRNFWKQAFPYSTFGLRDEDIVDNLNLTLITDATWDPAGDQKAFIKFRYIRSDGRLSPFVYDSGTSIAF